MAKQKNPYQGVRDWIKPPTEAQKILMSFAKLGKKHPKYKGFYLIDGKKYYSAQQAEDATGINKRTILRRCKQNKGGYNFVEDPNKEF